MGSSQRSDSWARKTLRKLARWAVYQYRVYRRPTVAIEGVRLRVGRRSARARAVEVPRKSLSEIAEQVRPTLLIVDAEGAEGDLFDRAQIPTVAGIVLELHERIIGEPEANRVRSILAAAGFIAVP